MVIHHKLLRHLIEIIHVEVTLSIVLKILNQILNVYGVLFLIQLLLELHLLLDVETLQVVIRRLLMHLH
jgi:hypothetical protein